MTHDYKRHGTTTLFAALNVATGEVPGKTYRKHRHQEVLRFLREVERQVPKDQEIHIVLDNYTTHKHEKVLGWIERNKRVFLHFTPTSASWGQSAGAVLCHVDRQADTPRGLYFGTPPRGMSQRISGQLQRKPPAIRLDEKRRRDRRKGRSGTSRVT